MSRTKKNLPHNPSFLRVCFLFYLGELSTATNFLFLLLFRHFFNVSDQAKHRANIVTTTKSEKGDDDCIKVENDE